MMAQLDPGHPLRPRSERVGYSPDMTALQDLAFAELTADQLHDILKLRVDVFVVEQECAYPELDGRDIEAGTRHIWISDDNGRIAAYLRLLSDTEATRVGRIVTSPLHRRSGMAARLLDHVLGHYHGDLVLDAQTYLAGWYEDRGFVKTGPEFLEDGIPHIPMHRANPTVSPVG